MHTPLTNALTNAKVENGRDFVANLSVALYSVHYVFEDGSRQITLAYDEAEMEQYVASAPEGVDIEVFVREDL